MAAKSTLVNMAACLTAVCLICGAILGGVYAITLNPIQQAAQKALTESINQVLPEGGELSDLQTIDIDGQSYEYYVSSVNGAPAAFAVKSSTIGFGGPLTVMVGVLPDKTIFNTSVLTCNETPGLGAKCQSDEAFMSQWKNFGADKVLKVKKDGGDVDAITASTITSRAYTLAVANAVNVVAAICGNASDAVTGASTK